VPVISVSGLSKSFGGLDAVSGLSFDVEEGEIYGLLGPNGAGKTTTVRMLACIISPSGGTAAVAGHDIRADPVAVRRSVGVLTESPSLYERLTAEENLTFFARAYGMTDDRKISGRVRELLQFFQLWDRRGEKSAVFSKGMKQKLAIARALVHDPPVIFLDEPTAGLDPEASKLIRDLITEMSQKERHTIMLCTHRLEDAEKVCSRVMVVNMGRRVVVGSPDEIRSEAAGKAKLEVVVANPSTALVEAASGVAGVSAGAIAENGRLIFELDDLNAATPLVVRALVESGARVLKVNTFLPSLEEAYLRLIKGGGGDSR